MIVAGFIAASLVICGSCSTQRKKGHNYARQLFHFQYGVWTPDHAAYAESAGGALWTVNPGGQLSKFEGDHWTHYGKAEFEEPKDRLAVRVTRLAFRDGEAWEITGNGVARFNGRSWRLYEDALKTDWPIDMVAGPSGVWVIDFYGNLSRFDGKNWTIRNVTDISSAPPPPGWGYWLDADEPPRLVLTDDGRLWIYWHGLWRQEGDGWREIRPRGIDFNGSLLIGHDDTSVWFRTKDSDILSVTPEGRIGVVYTWRQMGLSQEPEIRSLAVVGQRMWVASSGGLLTFDSQRWQNLGSPPGYPWVARVTVAMDGSVWVLGVKEVT